VVYRSSKKNDDLKIKKHNDKRGILDGGKEVQLLASSVRLRKIQFYTHTSR